MIWAGTANGFDIGLLDDKIVCRGQDGKILRRMPAALKTDPALIELQHLREWLIRHQATCIGEVEKWMVRSLPVPFAVLAQVWPDPRWRRALRDLVVRAEDDQDGATGLLREVDQERGAGLLTADGDITWLRARTFLVPHPVLLPELAELRRFATEFGAEQSVSQLLRPIWHRFDNVDPAAKSVPDWSQGEFEKLGELTDRATALGCPVRGGFAVQKVFEAGQELTARFWIGSDSPSMTTMTGDLDWVNQRGVPLPLGEVGPVAWSEGARLAATLHPGGGAKEVAG